MPQYRPLYLYNDISLKVIPQGQPAEKTLINLFCIIEYDNSSNEVKLVCEVNGGSIHD